MARVILCLGACIFLTGCAAVAPISSLLNTPTGAGNPPLQVHDETSVRLASDNFVLVKTNVVGSSHGFSLLGIITIVPATLNKAMNRLYANAEMKPGQPQTVAHILIEQTSSYFILFGIPQVDVRADIVQFRPPSPGPPPRNPPLPPPPGPPPESR